MNCPKCEGRIYCIDTRPVFFGDSIVSGLDQKTAILTCARERSYVCIDCDRRFKSIEVLIPHEYSRKKMSKSKQIATFGKVVT